MRVLIVGQGGREHAIGWRIKMDGHETFFLPGNGGTLVNIDGNPEDPADVKRACIDRRIDFVVVGPEVPLERGLVDELEKAKISVFGPRKEFAKIETSKAFAKELMREEGIPTPTFEIFNDQDKARKYISGRTPIVVKASGLCAGKGSIVCLTENEAEDAIEKIMSKRVFGEAGSTVVIEEYLEGREVSYFAVCSGDDFLGIGVARDYKRAYDGDRGPNTGGMGAYSPVEYVDRNTITKIEDEVIKPLIKALKKRGIEYRGVIYAGLMLSGDKPYVLEFNARFGDPEAQVTLPLIEGDFSKLLLEASLGKLSKVNVIKKSALCIVIASGGYPGKYKKGKVIEGLKKAEREEGVLIFHAGTRRQGNKFITWGGRVLNIVGLGSDMKEARDRAYKASSFIRFEGAFKRSDIGL